MIDQLIEIANSIYKELGSGHQESVYENAMAIELRRRGIQYKVQPTAEILYQGQKVGEHRLDLLVEGNVVVELKAAASISKGNTAQICAYMRTCGISSGLLLNFPYPTKDKVDYEVEP